MPELVLFACFAIALFTFILQVNHNDRKEVVATALETKRLEEGLLRDLEKAEGITKTPCKATTGSWQKIWVRLITKTKPNMNIEKPLPIFNTIPETWPRTSSYV